MAKDHKGVYFFLPELGTIKRNKRQTNNDSVKY